MDNTKQAEIAQSLLLLEEAIDATRKSVLNEASAYAHLADAAKSLIIAIEGPGKTIGHIARGVRALA
jgi:hypothetical protein